MGDKLLHRAFELAEQAVEAEKDDSKVAKAKELFTASIDAFKAALALPGLVQDSATRALISKEVEGLKQRKAELVARVDQQKQLEARVRKLKDEVPTGSDEALELLKERFEKLKSNGVEPKPVLSLEEISDKLKALQTSSSSTIADSDTRSESMTTTNQRAAKLPADNPFANDDWKRGLDPELLDLIQKARDEASLM